MRRRVSMALFLALALLVSAACGKGTKKVQTPQTEVPSLQAIRQYAVRALDTTLSSDDRQKARNQAFSSLVGFLKTPASLQVTKADWEREVQPGSGPMVRMFQADQLRVFAIALAVPGVVPPGERVAVQVSSSAGAPEAWELASMPGGAAVAAGASREGGQTSLTVAYSLIRGGGYVANYLRDSKTGEFRANPNALRGLPLRAGDFTLEMRDSFLMVQRPSPEPWRPRFETKTSLRLFLDSDIAFEWKGGRFQVIDDRTLSAFQGFLTALDPRADRTTREEAWEKAITRLPGYLQDLESWSDDLAGKLPPGAFVGQDQIPNMAIRLVSIPSPMLTGPRSFTVVQYRSGGGLPSVQVILIPGTVEGVRLITRQGLPGLLILSDAPNGGTGPGAKVPWRKAISLFRQTAGSTWEPAPEWFGYFPEAAGWNLQRPVNQGYVTLEPSPPPAQTGPNPTFALAASGAPGVQACLPPTDCFSLIWSGSSLTGADWVAAKLRAISTRAGGAPVSLRQFAEASVAVQRLLESTEGQAMEAGQMETLLGRDAGVSISVFDAGAGTKVVAMPADPTGDLPLIIGAGPRVLQESPAPRVVDRWVGARVVEANGARWLLVLGRSPVASLLTTYRWTEVGWSTAPALETRLDRSVGRAQLNFAPGQTIPYRGIYFYGSTGASATFTPDGRGVQFCDDQRTCVSYVYETKWVLR